MLAHSLRCSEGLDTFYAAMQEALAIHHRNWKEVAAHVGTKTVVQVCISWFCLMVAKPAGLCHFSKLVCYAESLCLLYALGS